jgi:hypothetical protein
MDRHRQLLRRRLGPIGRGHQFDATPPVTHVVEGEVACDAEDPRAASGRIGVGDLCPRDAQEDFLRKVLRGFGLADDAAQVPKNTLALLGEQEMGVSDGRSFRNNPSRRGSCQTASFRARCHLYV